MRNNPTMILLLILSFVSALFLTALQIDAKEQLVELDYVLFVKAQSPILLLALVGTHIVFYPFSRLLVTRTVRSVFGILIGALVSLIFYPGLARSWLKYYFVNEYEVFPLIFDALTLIVFVTAFSAIFLADRYFSSR